MLRVTPAGERDRKLKFFAEGVTQTARGAMKQGKGALIASPWAKVNYGTGAERREAGKESSTVAATARVPANTRTRLINAGCFCELDGATWDVTSTAPWGRREIDITLIRRDS